MNAAAGLEALQLALQQHVLGQPSGIEAAVARGVGPDVARRLDIYRYAHRARLVDALRDSFGHTAAYLGTEAFERLASAYVQAHPSRHANIRWYGGDLPAWIGGRHAGTPEVAELAALDWALRCAFDGPDAIPMDLGGLAMLAAGDCEAVRLALQPTVQRLNLRHNTVALWHALDEGLAPPAAARLPQAVELLVWRRGEQPHFRTLGSIEAAALALVAGDRTFGEACAELASAFPKADIPTEAGTLLRRWVDEGLLAAAS